MDRQTTRTRITVTFSAEATAWLEQQAERRAITMAETVRRIVDEMRGDRISRPREETPR
jgi:hypothetical protein